ncbi:hypothetical protein ccbrp13_41620 [Ktedonobacteria bacterium brp13]|nr:hypothetical protein ccbrp13_41620 [Ktedonobacteria bacterium brp13]
MEPYSLVQEVEGKIQNVRYRDRFLLDNDVNECSISHRFAIYLNLQEEFGDSVVALIMHPVRDSMINADLSPSHIQHVTWNKLIM